MATASICDQILTCDGDEPSHPPVSPLAPHAPPPSPHTHDYGQQLLQRLGRFWEHKLFCDLTLRVENVSFQVHRLVLAACSDYFEAMFSHNMKERHVDHLDLPTVEAAGFEPLLQYAYTGILPLTLLNVEAILPAAAFLQITPALAVISDFLKSKMTFENAKRLVRLGKSYGLMDLQEHHRKMILKNFMAFTETEHFLDLDPMHLSGYLMEDTLKTPNEQALLKSVLKWYQHDPCAREEHMPEVLDKIRYTLDGWPTIEFAHKQEPFISNRECREIVNWCERYMQNPAGKVVLQSYRTRERYPQKTLIQMGGLRGSFPSFAGFELPPDDDGIAEERTGYMLNHYYHRELQRWMPMGSIGTADASSHSPLVEVNDFAILVGGYLYTTDFTLGRYQHCSNEVKLVQPSGSFALWDLPFLQEARAHHTAVYCKGYVYAIGGKNEGGPLVSVERYSIEEEEWTFTEDLPLPLHDHASATHNDMVFVSGGIQKGEVINQVLCYLPSADEWTARPPMLEARAGHALASIGDSLYACGGISGFNERCLASLESYDQHAQQWSFITPMRQDCSYMTPVVLDGKLLIVGGENSVGDLLTQVQEFDPKTQSWGTFCSLPIAMKNVGCCAVTVKLTSSGCQDDLIRELDEQHSDEGDEYDDEDEDDDYGDLREDKPFEINPLPRRGDGGGGGFFSSFFG